MNNSTHERNVAGRGLEQINAECLKLKRQLKVRDKQLEDLTEEANQLQFRNGELTEKLASIRVDMGLPAAHAQCVSRAGRPSSAWLLPDRAVRLTGANI